MPAKTLDLLEWSRLTSHLSTFTMTKLGSLVTQQLTPPQSLRESQRLLQQTQEVVELESRTGSLSFDGVQDISGSLERAGRHGILGGLELLNIATTLSAARQLRRIVDKFPELVSINDLVSGLRTFPELEKEIHHCLDDHGDVEDRASEKIAEVRDRLRHTRQKVQQILQSILQRKAGALQELLITQRSDRFVLPVKAAQKDAVPGIVHDSSASGVTLYIEPQSTVSLNNQMRQLTRQEQVESERIRQALTEKVAAVLPELEFCWTS